MSTCCSSGKARVYYNIPQQGGLKYKLKNSTKWATISENETLSHDCKINQNLNRQYSVKIKFSCSLSGNSEANDILLGPLAGKILFREKIEYSNSGMSIYLWQFSTNSGISWINSGCNTRKAPEDTGDRDLLLSHSVEIDLIDDPKPKKFTVTGTETGTKYLEIEVDECPDVQTIPCKFDPAKEQFIDVEMIPYTELPIPFPNYPIFQDCIEITSVGDLVVIEKVTTRNYGPTGDNDPSVRETTKIIKSIESPKGCPAPKVRVECGPNGICGEDKKCPKGTTCELICNGFKCCYSKGVLIRSIKL